MRSAVPLWKPCPFCGLAPYIRTSITFCVGPGIEYPSHCLAQADVTCRKCGAVVTKYADGDVNRISELAEEAQKKAIDAWNNRPRRRMVAS